MVDKLFQIVVGKKGDYCHRHYHIEPIWEISCNGTRFSSASREVDDPCDCKDDIKIYVNNQIPN